MFRRIKPEDSERENRVLLQLAGTRIGRRRYAVGRCYVAGVPAIAVKAGREKYIGKRGAVVDWLTGRGLTSRQARSFLREGLDRWDLQQLIDERFTQGR